MNIIKKKKYQMNHKFVAHILTFPIFFFLELSIYWALMIGEWIFNSLIYVFLWVVNNFQCEF